MIDFALFFHSCRPVGFQACLLRRYMLRGLEPRRRSGKKPSNKLSDRGKVLRANWYKGSRNWRVLSLPLRDKNTYTSVSIVPLDWEISSGLILCILLTSSCNFQFKT